VHSLLGIVVCGKQGRVTSTGSLQAGAFHHAVQFVLNWTRNTRGSRLAAEAIALVAWHPLATMWHSSNPQALHS
jgi:hypothetical protein